MNSNFYDSNYVIKYDAKFKKIINFYLFECPARHTIKHKNDSGEYEFSFSKVSVKGKTFSERGIEGHGLIALHKAMRKASYKGKILDLSLNTANEIESYSQNDGEICLVLKNKNISQTDAIYYCIRNAFAHGSFSKDKQYYYFENMNKGKLKGRIRVKEKTLLEWNKLCSMSVEEIKKYNLDK